MNRQTSTGIFCRWDGSCKAESSPVARYHRGMRRKCAKRIAAFARAYRSEHVRTPRQLYDETGYDTQHTSISQADIEAVVSDDLSLVDDWIAFTDDKRWTPAWGLSKCGRKSWVVFRVKKGGGIACEVRFTSPVPACALMIRLDGRLPARWTICLNCAHCPSFDVLSSVCDAFDARGANASQSRACQLRRARRKPPSRRFSLSLRPLHPVRIAIGLSA